MSGLLSAVEVGRSPLPQEEFRMHALLRRAPRLLSPGKRARMVYPIVTIVAVVLAIILAIMSLSSLAWASTNAGEGTFQVSKQTDGLPAGTGESTSFDFEWTCGQGDAAVSGQLQVKGDGVPVSPQKADGSGVRMFPLGTSCTVTEVAGIGAVTDYTLTAPESQTMQITSDIEPAAFSFTNTYKPDTGSFEISKETVVEAGASFADESFPIVYQCGSADPVTVSLANGKNTVIQDVPVGTTCTITEEKADKTGYTHSISYQVNDQPGNTVTIVKDKVAQVKVTNTFTPKTGSFSISKTVTGDAGFLLGGKDYTFEYQCTDLNGNVGEKQTVTLKAGEGHPVSVNNVREGACTITEVGADVDNADRTTTFTVKGADSTEQATQAESATVTIKEGTAPSEVAVTNDYTVHRGDFAVAKNVTADTGTIAPDKQFSFDYICTQPDGIEVVGTVGEVTAGVVKNAGVNLPVGTSCTVSEVAGSAGVDQYDVALSAPVDVTIGKDTVVEAAFTNTYTHHTGTFEVTKKVEGAQVGDQEFTFSYACTDGTEGSLKVKADGNAVAAGASLPTGTSCTITEDAKTAEVNGYTLAAPAAQRITINDKDQVVMVEVINSYTPVDQPGASSKPDGTLARTGISPLVPGTAAALAMIVGGLLVRRRTSE